MQKKVVISVSNDVATDQRVLKVAAELKSAGADITIIGRLLPGSLDIEIEGVKIIRYRMLFKKGFLFYKFLNIRLFFTLIRRKADILVANDLDTLLPNFLVSKIRKIDLVYDAHEYFTGGAELVGRRFVRGIWKFIERLIVPRLDYMMTVNQSIADLYASEYPVTPVVVRNFSRQWIGERASRNELGIPESDLLCVIQGTGLNQGRGGLELIEAVSELVGVHLIIIGRGDMVVKMKERVLELGLINTITFLPVMLWDEMMSYTAMADVGLSLDSSDSVNYSLSLPNKLFDYMDAGVALIATNLLEVSTVIHGSGCGITIEDSKSEDIREAIMRFRDNRELLDGCRKRSKEASKKYCWTSELKNLHNLYNSLGLEFN